MPVAPKQFIKDLLASRLLSDEQVAELQRDLRQLPGDQRPRSAEELARVLVQRGWLTKFQAAAIYQGETQWLVFGDYVVLDKIGAGQMGFVFKAQRRGSDEVVALKVLPRQRMEESSHALQRFLREIQLNLRLRHPNIVRMHDAGYDNDTPFLVMEYVDGGDLGTLAKSQRLGVAQTVDYVLQVARGLAYAHGQGIIHRDIKPSNLLLDASGTVKVLDLGLARLDDSAGEEGPGGERLTRHVQLLGTPNYMAPEQAHDPRNADVRCDVYSLGCTWFCLLTGRAPYERATKVETLMAHYQEPIPSLRQQRGDVPPELEATWQKMMAKDPGDRFQTMHEVVAALENQDQSTEDASSQPPVRQGVVEDVVQAPMALPAEVPAADAGQPQRWPGKVRLLLGIILGVILLAVLAVVLLKA